VVKYQNRSDIIAAFPMYTLPKSIRNYALAFALGLQSFVGIDSAAAEPKTVCPSPAVVESSTPSQGRQVPHYLQDVRGDISDRIDRMEYKWRLTQSLSKKYACEGKKVDFMGLAIRSTENVAGQDVEVVFKDYRREQQDGKDAVAYYSGLGREFITPQQFESVKKDIVQTLERSVEFAYQNHRELEPAMYSALDGWLKKEGKIKEGDSIKKHLDEILVQGSKCEPSVLLSQAMYLPSVSKSDFVPKKLIFGNLSDGILGMCYLDSGWVFYDGMARVWDHIDGKLTVLAHELEHRNPKLQGMPFAFRFDPECLAEAAIMSDVDPFTFLHHGYLNDVRHMSKVLFGLDSERIAREAFLFTEGGVEIDKDVLAKYVKMIDPVARGVKKEVMERFLPEFFTHFGFYSAINQMYHDKNQGLKGWFYLNYEPTSLGGAVNTRRRLAKLEPVIDEAWEEAKKNLRDESIKPSMNVGDKADFEARVVEAMEFLKREGVSLNRICKEDAVRLYESLERMGIIEPGVSGARRDPR